LLFITAALWGNDKANILPQPSGINEVGVTYLDFSDESRKELFDNTGKTYRKITVKSWYPADKKSHLQPYFLKADFAVDNIQFPEIFRNLETNSGRDLPVSSTKPDYPVLVFSHGWGEHFAQNTILMEELASHGYIIFSVAHHFECSFSEYGDGRTIHLDVNNQRFQKIWKEQQNPKALELLNKMYNATNEEECRRVFLETSELLPTLLNESPKYWAEDIAFILDQLQILNTKHDLFKTKLCLDKIGVFGMSMGGIATSEICLRDKRIKAGINIDGGLNVSTLEGSYQNPFMFLNGKRFIGYGPFFTSRSTSDCLSISVKNADHYNFTDYSLYPYPLVERLMGSIDRKRIIEIMNTLVLSFFDRYLKENRDVELRKAAGEYPEIEVVSNIDSGQT